MLLTIKILGFILILTVLLLAIAGAVYLTVCLIDMILDKWKRDIRWTLKDLREKI